MKKYLISGIGPGPTGVGRLMNQLVEESTRNGYINIYNFASKPVRKLVQDKKYLVLGKEVFLRLVHSLWFYFKIYRVKNAEVILVYPQGIGIDKSKRLMRENRVVKLYIMDNSFFCMKSYNYLNGECLICLDNFENFDSTCSPAPRLFETKKYIAFLNFVKANINDIKLYAQCESHKVLLQKVYGEDTSINVVGMDTGEFHFPKIQNTIKSISHKKTIVFHNHLIDSKGFSYALAIATQMKQYDFIFPSKKPVGMKDFPNIRYEDMTWDSGLKELVINADLILCLSMWSTSIEGALVKSLYYNGNVAVMDNQYGFNTEIPDDIVIKLSYDLSIAIEQIEIFMKNEKLDLQESSIAWLEVLYDSYNISKLFQS